MSPHEELAAAAHGLAALLEAEAKGLRAQHHQKTLAPVQKKLKAVVAGYFDRQGAAILKDIKPRIKAVLAAHPPPVKESFREASGGGRLFAHVLLPSSVSPLQFPATSAENDGYSDAITDAITGAGLTLAAEMKSGAALSDDVAGRYLRDNSLSKLTGGFADETVSQLRTAIATAWDAGGSADQIVSAVQDTMDGFSDYRAGMIAQTEANDAYNAGRSAMADQMDMDEKSWETESGDPCPECEGNEDAGWIDIDDSFPSGDDAPTAHPNCQCSLNFRQSAG